MRIGGEVSLQIPRIHQDTSQVSRGRRSYEVGDSGFGISEVVEFAGFKFSWGIEGFRDLGIQVVLVFGVTVCVGLGRFRFRQYAEQQQTQEFESMYGVNAELFDTADEMQRA